MAKDKIAYVCTSCGYDSPKWIGKCPSCGEWNTFKEQKVGKPGGGPAFSQSTLGNGSSPISMSHIKTDDEPRINLFDNELNRVLGGGLVPGSLVLLGGEPGIGKSTLTLQTVLQLQNRRILYISGEESARQIKLRADRLGPTNEGLYILCETSLEQIFQHIEEMKPDLVVIDSIQTIQTETVESSAGSLTQIRECAAALLRYAKTGGVSILLIGHINKEGTLAGPKVLEHIVDVVLQFEGDQHHLYRILRSIKNRFGSTSELGIYEMRHDGLRQVSNPSELLLTDNREGLSGVAISCSMEGVRPFLIETQALVSTAAYGTAQRSTTGFDGRRLNMLLAVLEKRAGFFFANMDAYVNIAGGIKMNEPAIDLGIALALASSFRDRPVGEKTICFGEVGLSGEVRAVSMAQQRVLEAKKLGFDSCILPKVCMSSLKGIEGIRLIGVSNVQEAFSAIARE